MRCELSGYGNYLENQLVHGMKNACGTTSLTGIMNYWSGEHTYTRDAVDREIRHGDLTTSIQQLRRFARSEGFRSRAVNDLSYEELGKAVDQGVPVQLLVQSFNNPKALHYVTAVGVERDAQGQLSAVQLADTIGPQWRRLTVDELEQRWGDLKYKGLPTGIHHPALFHLPGKPTEVVGSDGVVRDASKIGLPKGHRMPISTNLMDAWLSIANRFTKPGPPQQD